MPPHPAEVFPVMRVGVEFKKGAVGADLARTDTSMVPSFKREIWPEGVKDAAASAQPASERGR